MKVNRRLVEEALEKRFIKITTKSDIREHFCQIAEEIRNIPYSVALDVVDMRIPPQELTEAELFWCMDICDNNSRDLGLPKYGIGNAFTDIEIKNYDALKYKKQTIRFPIVFDMVEITPTQWIGSIDLKTLMSLRKSQLISYNANIQRTLRRKVRGETEYWTISVNRHAVNQISDLLEENAFIPNTLTLNIPADDYDADFSYNSETKKFIIRKLDHFDITDGYHRFLALCRQADTNKNFDFTMELRITNFTTEKGQQFIFQEDQKTQMKKSDSQTMNQNRAANIVVERLNENPLFYLKGEIKRSGGSIRYADFAEAIEYLWFSGSQSKQEERRLTIELPKKLVSWINTVIDEAGESYLKRKYDRIMIVSILATAFQCDGNYKHGIFDVIKNIYAKLNEQKLKSFKRMMREAIKIAKEELDHV